MAEALPRTLLALAVGLLASFVIELTLRPRPQPAWRRPFAILSVHLGIWLLAFAAELAAFRRPWFAAANVDALMITLAVVSNAKLDLLREPFVFQDFEYFTDALRHPRLYLPFLGLARALLALGVIVGVVALGLALEASIVPAIGVTKFLALLALLVALGASSLAASGRRLPSATYAPAVDLHRFGLLAFLWRYGIDDRHTAPLPQSKFRAPAAAALSAAPDLIAIQSESFFDIRRHLPGINAGVLANFDALKAAAAAFGPLQVGAWGANTVRTEFAFLGGFDPEDLGVHRFNPYRRLARQPLPSVASYLRGRGYRTVCLHPYPGSFYGRDRVLPALGFDEFIDIAGFTGALRAGPFVSDEAVADAIRTLLGAAGRSQPLFVFAITMENHGPLHLETTTGEDVARLFVSPPPADCADLVVYLRHLANADRMIGALREFLEAAPRPAGLCFYGDHVPIMERVYAALGSPDGATDYLIWNKGERSPQQGSATLGVESLAQLWLELAGVMDRRRYDPGSASTVAP